MNKLDSKYQAFIEEFSNGVLDIFDDEYAKILKGGSDERLKSLFDKAFEEHYGKQFDFNILSWSAFIEPTDASKYIKKKIRDRYFKDYEKLDSIKV